MLSSQLNKVIQIDRGVSGLSPVGSPILIWYKWLSTYSSVTVLSGDARMPIGDGEEFAVQTRFYLRYNNLTKIINNKFRILYNEQVYKIIQVREIGVKDGIEIITIFFEND